MSQMTTDMSALLRFTDSDCLIDIFRLFFRLTNITIFYDWPPVILTHIVTMEQELVTVPEHINSSRGLVRFLLFIRPLVYSRFDAKIKPLSIKSYFRTGEQLKMVPILASAKERTMT